MWLFCVFWMAYAIPWAWDYTKRLAKEIPVATLTDYRKMY